VLALLTILISQDPHEKIDFFGTLNNVFHIFATRKIDFAKNRT
jgi:hypothetical protein